MTDRPEESGLLGGLAIVANTMTPYRLHLHKEVARLIPELTLHTLLSHGDAEFSWDLEVPESIHLASFKVADESPLERIYSSPLREWRKGGRVVEFIKQNDIRAVILPLPRYFSYLRVLRHCRRHGIPVFVRSDANVNNDTLKSPLRNFLGKRFHSAWAALPDGIMPMGEFGKQNFERFGVPREKMYLVPYLPDVSRFEQPPAEAIEQAKQQYGFAAGRKRFVFSGRLVPIKRVDMILKAFERIASERPDWDLVVVGDGALRDKLKAQAPAGLADRITWTGFVDPALLSGIYHACDALLLPSDREPWGVVVQEAMAARLPVIASHVVGAAEELVTSHESGVRFPAGDLDGLSDAMLEVSEPGRLAGFKEAAAASLATWMKECHPVLGIRRALVTAGVLTTADPPADHQPAPA